MPTEMARRAPLARQDNEDERQEQPANMTAVTIIGRLPHAIPWTGWSTWPDTSSPSDSSLNLTAVTSWFGLRRLIVVERSGVVVVLPASRFTLTLTLTGMG